MSPLSITLDRESRVPVYRQIVDQIRDALATGSIGPDDRLPTLRALAGRLGVNRLTVARAYDHLSEEGLIASHIGRGTFAVRGGQPERSLHPPPGPAWESLFARTPERAFERPFPSAAMTSAGEGTISFASLYPDPDLFPVKEFRDCVDQVLGRQGAAVLAYGPPSGYPPLREMVAKMLGERGIEASAEDVLITSGSQQAIDLVARALLDPGDSVVVENPTFLGAVQVFQSLGARLAGVPVDEPDRLVEHLEQAAARRNPKLAYFMPSFQNPTSRTIDLEARRGLVSIAAGRRFVLLEDDFAADLRYEGTDLPPLKALPGGGSVVYVSTFAKKLLPGLRVGWVVAPPRLIDRLISLKKITDYGTSLLPQAALHEFCRRGNLDHHLKKVSAAYRSRRDSMLDAMEREFPDGVSWTRPEGGLSIWVTLPDGVSADEVAGEAESRSVVVGRGDLFYVESPRRENLRLAYSMTSPAIIRKGIAVLGEIIRRRMTEGPIPRREKRAEPMPLI